MDNKGLSTMQGFIKECCSLLTNPDQKHLWKTHSRTTTLPLESFQNTFDFHTNTEFYLEHFRNNTFSFFSIVYSMHWWAVIILNLFPFVTALPAVCCRMHELQSDWDYWQSLGGWCCTLSGDKLCQFVHGTPHLPLGPKKGPVSSPTTWGFFDPPHPSPPLPIDGSFEK